MRFLLIVSAAVFSSWSVNAACPAAPVGTPNDPLLQLRLNGDGKAALGPSNYFDATEEGALVWDDTNNTIAFCDGSNWVAVDGAGTELPDCGVGDHLVMGATGWECDNNLSPPPPPGSKYIFITAATYNGNLGGVAGAHSKCQDQASGAGLPGTYKAWISTTSNTDAPISSHAQHNGPYYLPDGTTKVADNWVDLTDGSLQNQINLDANSNTVSSVKVWSNVVASGAVYETTRPDLHTCEEWTSASGDDGSVGLNSSTGVAWTENFDESRSCFEMNHLYCVGQ